MTEALADAPADYKLVDLEATLHPALAARELRERVVPGMFVRLLVVTASSKKPTKVWVQVRIAGGTVLFGERTAYGEYAGVVVGDHLDLDRGDAIEFGPQHVLEWSVVPC